MNNYGKFSKGAAKSKPRPSVLGFRSNKVHGDNSSLKDKIGRCVAQSDNTTVLRRDVKTFRNLRNC